MDNKLAVSVIVPVYNVEKYLRRCLDSLVSQTLENLEIIIVNDGSTDGSQYIIDEYVTKYPNKLVALIKDNGGLGEARNCGLQKARGEYIGFVDSDDWVDHKMFESMYNKTRAGYDIILCDFMVIKDGCETGQISKGFRGSTFNHKEAIINSIDPATACNKLYKRSLFELIDFPDYWYEDIGTTPIFLSYAKSIGYLESPMYFYRQRGGSITSSSDKRTLGVIKAWSRVLAQANEEFRSEIIMAVCKSIAAFIEFKPEFADEYLEFAKENFEILNSNTYYQDAVKNKVIPDILKMELIPKKIHYFWFGQSEKSELIQKCFDSWKTYAGDYEIIEWNETNCNINENIYVAEAYEAKKWAFVADYFRIKVIYEHGGIYVDTDMEFLKRIDSLRLSDAFFAFETREAVHAGILGANRQHDLIKQWLNTYEDEHFKKSDGSYNTSHTIVKRLTSILVTDFKINMNGKYQVLRENIKIYSPNVLTIDVYDGKNLTIHHYDASWWDVKDEVSYKYIVLQDYFLSNENGPRNHLKQINRKLRLIADNDKSFKGTVIHLGLSFFYMIYKKMKK
jgi:glycosyltransferase involved in cell wall biosynthesis